MLSSDHFFIVFKANNAYFHIMGNKENFIDISTASDQDEDYMSGEEAFEILENVARTAQENGLTAEIMDAAVEWVRELEDEPESVKTCC